MKYIIKYILLFTLGFTQSSDNPVSIKASLGNLTARAGEVVEVELDVIMTDEWHIYSVYKVSEGPLPTEISIGGEIVGSVAPLTEPKPINKFDPGFETVTYYHEGDTKFKIPFKIKRNAKPGEYKISVDIFYMVCNIRLCYPPVTKTDSISIIIEEGDIREGKSSFLISTSSNEDSGKSQNDSDSLLGVFLLAIGGAILSWVMPCVYPMIPIIISFFGKMSQEKHIGRNTIATFYGLGISGTFIFIGYNCVERETFKV